MSSEHKAAVATVRRALAVYDRYPTSESRADLIGKVRDNLPALESMAERLEAADANAALRSELARVRDIGGLMSNVLFNWKQDPGRFSAYERGMMANLQTKWDAALSPAAPQEGE